MDDVTALVERARAAAAMATSRLATARYAQWQGVHAEEYRARLADAAARVAVLEREIAAARPLLLAP
ncbi:hypothetical protein [Demequina sp.]|uniref:hypothetical protein n=1 Tax=Demequina sp. TaxID=2050685 RepID=UPI0025DB3EFA|nr:hypothetical protein [Demequina sp.]